MELFDLLNIKPKAAYVDGEQPETKESYKQVRETEQASGVDRNIKLKRTNVKRLKPKKFVKLLM